VGVCGTGVLRIWNDLRIVKDVEIFDRDNSWI